MKDLTFETGLITYNLNGNAQVTFNPTDSTFVERLFNTFDSLDNALNRNIPLKLANSGQKG